MGGHILDQPLPFGDLEQIDPFLLIHHWKDTMPGGQNQRDVGVGPHPHRGFSPVTFIYKGAVHHRDSRGNDDIVHEGGIQWMNAGMGITHSERPSAQLAEEGGEMEFIQLWINSPASQKLIQPQYQALQKEDIPTIESDSKDASLQVIAGDFQNTSGPIKATSELMILNISMKAGASVEIPVPDDFNAVLYQLDGRVKLCDQETTHVKNMTWFENDGTTVKLDCERDSRALFLAGKPINEPLATYGPFVMNNQTEIMEALRDSKQGKMGILIEEF